MFRTAAATLVALTFATPAFAASHSEKAAGATLSVLYPATPGSKFNAAYYRDKHGQVVRNAWGKRGMTGMTVSYGAARLGGGASPYHVVTMIRFKDRASLDAAVGGPSGAPVFADIKNFTNVAPVAMIGN